MRKLFFTLVASIAATAPVYAEVFELPPEGHDVIGTVSAITARYEDTLVDIARRHGLGYYDLVRANPGVDVWVPGEGTQVVLPTRFVLPPGPREGVVLNLAEYRMYYYPQPEPGEQAVVMTYPISIGRMDWETPLGVTRVIAKAVNPTWYPPQSVRKEHEEQGRPLPSVVPPGPDNPLGAFAMRLGLPGYLIHGTNRPAGVGMRVTHGCIRMFPEDIEFLFPKIDVKTPVRIVNMPVKIGWFGDELVLESHPVLETVAVPIDDEGEMPEEALVTEMPKSPLTQVTEQFIAATAVRAARLNWEDVERHIERSDGIPVSVGTEHKIETPVVASQ
jgi:L,D-transpeptidase ErfK/SrfK